MKSNNYLRLKSISFPLLLLVVSLTACAQSSNLDKFYQKYQATQHEDKDGISINPSLLLNISFSGDSDSKASGKSSDNWFRKITSLHCLSIDASQAQEWSDLSRSLSKDDFEEWCSVRHGKGKFQLLSRDGKGDLSEIVALIVGKEGNGLFFHLRGHFTAADKARMQSALQDNDSN